MKKPPPPPSLQIDDPITIGVSPWLFAGAMMSVMISFVFAALLILHSVH